MQNRRYTGLFGGVLGAALGLGGCVANITSDDPGAGTPTSGLSGPGGTTGPGGAGQPGSKPGACVGGQVGPERIHRLTPNEYTNTLRTLLGDDTLQSR